MVALEDRNLRERGIIMTETIRNKASKYFTSAILAVSLGAIGVIGVAAAQPEIALAETVDYGASWNYGRNAGVYAYSSVFSSTHWHSASVTASNGAYDYDQAAPQYQAYAEIWVAPWDHVQFYWNVW